MARLTKDQICTAVYQQIEDSEGFEKDELARMRRDALDYYYQRDRAAPSVDGRSSLQSSDVADMIEAIVAQMMPAFENDSVAEFEPTGEQDVEQARAESKAVEYVVMQQNHGHYEIQQAIRDALLLRNGIIKVWHDEKIDIEPETFNQLTELEYGQLNANAVQSLKSVDNGYTISLQNEEDGFYDARIVKKTTTRKIRSEAIDPTNFSWERDYTSIYLQDARFVAERSLPTRSDLIERGYSKKLVMGLNAGGHDTHIDSVARNQHDQRRNWRGATPAEDILEFYECFIRIDADGDNQTELLKVCVADKQILEIQEMQYIPYAAGTGFVQPHRFNGLSIFDKLRHVQDQKTFGVRQWADNLNNTNNVRVTVVDGQVNIDDVTNSRPGGVIRQTMPGAVEPLPVHDVGPSAQQFLDYGDKMRAERGGASLDMQSAEMQVAGDTAHGVERIMTSKEQMAAMMTRSIAETLLRTTWLLVHKALRLYVSEPMEFRAAGKFVTVNPAEWQERDNITVKAGLTPAERQRKSMALASVVARQDALLQQGAYVDAQDVYNANMDWARCQGLDHPESYFTDPQSEEAMQQQQAQQEQAQQQQQYQQMLLDLQKEAEDRKADQEDAKIIEDSRQADQEMDFKYWEVQQNNELEEAKITTDTAIKMVSNERRQEPSDTTAGKSPVRSASGSV